MSGELLSRLAAYPKLRTVLETLPPKMMRFSSDEPAMRVEFRADQRIPFRSSRFCKKPHPGFIQEFPPFSRVAFLTRGDDIFPERFSSLGAGTDMIDA